MLRVSVLPSEYMRITTVSPWIHRNGKALHSVQCFGTLRGRPLTGKHRIITTPNLESMPDLPAIAATISASDFPVFRTAMDNPTAQAVVKAIERAKGSPIVQAVSMGGTVPMYLLTGSRHTPVLGVPIANHDDNQHAADENLRLQNLWDAIEVYATILATVGNDKSAWPSSNY